MSELGNPHVQNTTTSSNMATAFAADFSRTAKPYGKHRAPNTPMSNLTKKKKRQKMIKGNNNTVEDTALYTSIIEQ